MAPSQDPMFAGLGQAMRVGTDLLAALIVGGLLGWLIDSYVLDSTPVGCGGWVSFGVDRWNSQRLPRSPAVGKLAVRHRVPFWKIRYILSNFIISFRFLFSV